MLQKIKKNKMAVDTMSYTYGLMLMQAERYRIQMERTEDARDRELMKGMYESSVANVKAVQKSHPDAIRDGEAIFVHLLREYSNLGRARSL